MRNSRYEIALLISAGLVLVWSGIAPRDRFTWLLEVAPVLIGAPILVATRKRFPLTRLVYTLLWIHAIILMVGGKYTYAEVPLGFWLQDAFGFSRNHYDRIGHFAQGFIPAMLAREVLIRRSPLGRQPLAAVSGGVLLPRLQRALRADRVLDRAGDG